MKLILVVITIAMLGSLNTTEISVQQALKLLKDTQPIKGGSMVAFFQAKQPENYALYQRQLEAISIIGKSSTSGCVGTLIPYLRYSISFAAETNGGRSSESLYYTKEIWPAFGAILEVKTSGDELREYCLDGHNPINYRITAFLVLRYVDKTTFQKVEHTLDREFINGSPSITAYLKRIEDGSAQFWGVPELN